MRMLRITLACVFHLGIGLCLTGQALAVVSVSPASGGTNISADRAADATSPAWTTLGAITISEQSGSSNRGDFSAGTGVTLILKVPTGFEFNTAVTPSITKSGNDITAWSVAVTDSTTITVTLTISGTSNNDSFTIGSTTGIQVRPTSGATLASGQIYRPTTGGGTFVMNGPTSTNNADGSGGTNYGSLSMVAGVAAQLAFVQQPSNATAGAAISPAITVRLRDQFGHNVSTTGISITMTLSSGTGALSGTTSQSTSSGVATFSNLSINLVGSKNLTASSAGLTSAVSSSFTITPAAANKLAIVQQPSNATAGVAISPAVTVQLQDQFGNSVSAVTNVTMALSSGTGALSGTTTRATDSSGLATFDDLSINLAGSKNLTASGSGLTAAVSSAFTISAAAAAKLAFAQQPSNATAGVAISPSVTVQLQDTFGNPVSSSGVSISLVALDRHGHAQRHHDAIHQRLRPRDVQRFEPQSHRLQKPHRRQRWPDLRRQ